MAKISEYGNYETDKSQSEVAKFQETGVLPVSGKYTDNGNMTTKNVKLSDLVGGGGAQVPKPTSGDVGKVLTVESADSLAWNEVSGTQPTYGEGLSYNAATNTLAFSYASSGGLVAEKSVISVQAGNGIVVDGGGVGIDTSKAHDGDVLTYNSTAEAVVWTAPSGGGGGLPDLSKLINLPDGWTDPSYAIQEIKLLCDIETDSNGTVKAANNLRWKIQYGSEASYTWNVN